MFCATFIFQTRSRANFKIYNAKDKYLISANFSFNKYAYASAQSGIKFWKQNILEISDSVWYIEIRKEYAVQYVHKHKSPQYREYWGDFFVGFGYRMILLLLPAKPLAKYSHD